MFIWEKKVKEIKGTKVHFEDWTEGEYTPTTLKYVQTEKSIEPIELENIFINEAVSGLFNVIHKHDVKNGQLVDIMNKIKSEIYYKELGIDEIIHDLIDSLVDHGIKSDLISKVLSKTTLDYNKNVDAVISKILGIEALDDLSARKIAELKNS